MRVGTALVFALGHRPGVHDVSYDPSANIYFSGFAEVGASRVTYQTQFVDAVRADALTERLKATIPSCAELSEVAYERFAFGVSVLRLTLHVNDAETLESITKIDDGLHSLQLSLTSEDAFLDTSVPSVTPLESIAPLWTSSVFFADSPAAGDRLFDVVREHTKVVEVPPNRNITRALCGIGISCIELREHPLDGSDEVVASTVRLLAHCAAFAAGVYRFDDWMMEQFLIDTRAPVTKVGRRSAASIALTLDASLFESLRVHRDLFLGPADRGLNDGWWAVWGMERLNTMVQESSARLDAARALRRQERLSLVQVLTGAAVLAVSYFVSLDPVADEFAAHDWFDPHPRRAAAVVLLLLSLLPFAVLARQAKRLRR